MLPRATSILDSNGPTARAQVNRLRTNPFQDQRIIAALRNQDAIAAAVKAPTKIVYLLFGSPLNIADLIQTMRDNGKLPLVNPDLLVGFSRDPCNVEYLANCGAAGIVSTHQDVLRAAKRHNLIAVQRTFALDSTAVEAGLRTIQQCQPDAVEVLPAVAAPRVAPRIRAAHPEMQIVAGGLISSLKEIESLIGAGLDAVSVSDPRLWVW